MIQVKYGLALLTGYKYLLVEKCDGRSDDRQTEGGSLQDVYLGDLKVTFMNPNQLISKGDRVCWGFVILRGLGRWDKFK